MKYELCIVERSSPGDLIVLHGPYDIEELPSEVLDALPDMIRQWEDHLEDELDRRGLEH